MMSVCLKAYRATVGRQLAGRQLHLCSAVAREERERRPAPQPWREERERRPAPQPWREERERRSASRPWERERRPARQPWGERERRSAPQLWGERDRRPAPQPWREERERRSAPQPWRGEDALGFVRSKGSRNIRKLRQQRFTKHILNLSRKEKLQEADEVFGVMKRRRVIPEAATYNVLIAGHARQGQAKHAFKLFNEMKKRSIAPTHHTYTSMFNACAVAGPSGCEYLDKIQSEVDRRNVVLNNISTNALINALARSGRHEEALKVFVDMSNRDLKPDIQTFSGLLLAASHDRNAGMSTAKRVWQEMITTGVNPDLYSYNLLLQCLRDAGLTGQEKKQHQFLQVNFPSEFTESSQLKTIKRKVDTELSVHFQPGRDYELSLYVCQRSAVRLLRNEDITVLCGAMLTAGVRPDIRCFNLLAALTPDTPALLIRMKESGVPPDNHFMLTAIKNQCRHRNLNGAKALCQYSKEKGLALSEGVWSVMAASCSSELQGMALLCDIKSSGVAVSGSVFSSLLRNAARRRSYEYITALMKEMRHSEVSPPSELLQILDSLLTDIPTSQRQKMRFNGFSGYYHLWKRTMNPDT